MHCSEKCKDVDCRHGRVLPTSELLLGLTKVNIQHRGIGSLHNNLLALCNGSVDVPHCVAYHGANALGILLEIRREEWRRLTVRVGGESGQHKNYTNKCMYSSFMEKMTIIEYGKKKTL